MSGGKPCQTEGCENPKRPGGGQRYCDPCYLDAKERRRVAACERTAAWKKANPERAKENEAQWRKAHPEKNNQWARVHPEEKKAYDQAYYLANAEKLKENARVWYAENTDRALINVAEYRRANPDKVAAHDAMRNYRRRTRIEDGEVELFEPREIYDRDSWICHICNQPIDPSTLWPDTRSASMDHVIPISCGGHHTRDNVKASHLGCNIRKGNRMEAVE